MVENQSLVDDYLSSNIIHRNEVDINEEILSYESKKINIKIISDKTRSSFN